MTRRRFYAPPAAFGPDERSVKLSADETRHARDVLRLQSGDEIFVFDGAGREFHCTIQNIHRDSAELSVITEVEPARPESSLKLTLAIALLKGEKFDLVIQKSTELGVNRIVPLVTERADIRPRDNEGAHKRLARWQRIALEAAKQTGRAYIPEIVAPLTYRLLLAAAAEAAAEAAEAAEAADKDISTTVTRLMFSERDGRSLSEVTNSVGGQPAEIVALVGPEGGWTDEEIGMAREGRWEIVTLGGRTLRAETAAIAVVTLLQHRFGDLV